MQIQIRLERELPAVEAPEYPRVESAHGPLEILVGVLEWNGGFPPHHAVEIAEHLTLARGVRNRNPEHDLGDAPILLQALDALHGLLEEVPVGVSGHASKDSGRSAGSGQAL